MDQVERQDCPTCRGAGDCPDCEGDGAPSWKVARSGRGIPYGSSADSPLLDEAEAAALKGLEAPMREGR